MFRPPTIGCFSADAAQLPGPAGRAAVRGVRPPAGPACGGACPAKRHAPGCSPAWRGAASGGYTAGACPGPGPVPHQPFSHRAPEAAPDRAAGRVASAPAQVRSGRVPAASRLLRPQPPHACAPQPAAGYSAPSRGQSSQQHTADNGQPLHACCPAACAPACRGHCCATPAAGGHIARCRG